MDIIEFIGQVTEHIVIPTNLEHILDDIDIFMEIFNKIAEFYVKSPYSSPMITTSRFFTRKPTITFEYFLHRCKKYIKPEIESLIASIILIDRYYKYKTDELKKYYSENTELTKTIISEFSIYKLFAASYAIAQKLMSDNFIGNTHVAETFGITNVEFISLQIKFLNTIKFDLWIPVETYNKYYSEILKFGFYYYYDSIMESLVF